MFPKSFLFFIFIMVIDIILKSVNDKKKIEKARNKRTGELSRRVPTKGETFSPHRKISSPNVKRKADNIEIREYEKPREEERALERKSRWDEPIFTETHKEAKTGIDEETIGKKKISNKQMKEDILKGIIYSEILSEPKSLRNRKSI